MLYINDKQTRTWENRLQVKNPLEKKMEIIWWLKDQLFWKIRVCVCVCVCVPNVRALNIKQKLTELKHETYSATIIVREWNIPLSTMKL